MPARRPSGRPARLGRADLLYLDGVPGQLGEASAALLGFARVPVKPLEEEKKEFPQIKDAGAETVQPDSQPTVIPEFPEEIPQLEFLRAVESETLAPSVLVPSGVSPITDTETAVPWHLSSPAAPPLAPWSRLAPFLRSRLGQVLPGSALDLPKLMRVIAQGLPLLRFPRRTRLAWAPQALVLWDCSSEMRPFQPDVQFLLRRLRKERGKHGLVVREVKRGPVPSALPRNLPPSTPVLALSTLGQLGRSESIQQGWQELARELAFRGQPGHALCPAPRSRWSADLAKAWPSGVWDTRARLPRQGGLRALPGPDGPSPALDLLLTLLAAATRVEAPLVRSLRLLLGPIADTGTEWEAWTHADCWSAPDCFGLRPEAYEPWLAKRRVLADRQPELVRQADVLIARHHRHLGCELEAESTLRATFPQTLEDRGRFTDAQAVLIAVVERLRRQALDPAASEVLQSGLAQWFDQMVDRLAPEQRAQPEHQPWLSRGLALAHVLLETGQKVIPAGIDADEYRQEMVRAEHPLPVPKNLRVVKVGNMVVLEEVGGSVVSKGTPLGHLRVGKPTVQVQVDGQPALRVPTRSLPVVLDALVGQGGLPWHLASDLQKLQLAGMTRPIWAKRLMHDRFGLRAEFEIGGAVFGMRWIPPGRFTMGSPEWEPGRSPNEGPQLEVVIPEGFWLGETPVTQAQWRAVVETAVPGFMGISSRDKSHLLNPAPSHFKAAKEVAGELPVESISWDDAEQFCLKTTRHLLAAGVKDLRFHLPSEAQWEYACRAGTDSALYTGSMQIKADHDAPALEDIAWYIGNSWKELEVTNPRETKDFVYKHPKGKTAGTHRVRLKQANPWGLHDMLGNVWEWCADPWDSEAYAKAMEGQPALTGTKNSPRVARGGSWINSARRCRAAYRFGYEPDDRGFDLGFRLAAGQEQGVGDPTVAERPKKAEGRSLFRRAGEGRADAPASARKTSSTEEIS